MLVFALCDGMPPNPKRICKMPDRAPILVVFGIDGEGEKRAFRFAERDAEPALKVPTLLGLRVAWIEDEAARPVPEALLQRDIFGHGNCNYCVARMPEQRATGGLMTGKADQSSTRICALNDELRRFGRGGRIMMTPGIQALGAEGIARVLAAVAAFDAFTGENDPYGEHDCAILAVDGIEVLFKIDYYDCDLVCHSPDPSDPTVTQRVMVVMLASEY